MSDESQQINDVRAILSSKVSLENFIRIMAIRQKGSDTVRGFVDEHVSSVYAWLVAGDDYWFDNVVHCVGGKTLKNLGTYREFIIFEILAETEVEIPECTSFVEMIKQQVEDSFKLELANVVAALKEGKITPNAAGIHMHEHSRGAIGCEMVRDSMRDCDIIRFVDSETRKVLESIDWYSNPFMS